MIVISRGNGFRVSFGLPDEDQFVKFSVALRDELYNFKDGRCLMVGMYLWLSIKDSGNRCFPKRETIRTRLHLDKDSFDRSMRNLENVRVAGRPFILKVHTRVKDSHRPRYYRGPNFYIVCPTDAELVRYTGRVVLMDSDYQELGVYGEDATQDTVVVESVPQDIVDPGNEGYDHQGEEEKKGFSADFLDFGEVVNPGIQGPRNKGYKKSLIKEDIIVKTGNFVSEESSPETGNKYPVREQPPEKASPDITHLLAAIKSPAPGRGSLTPSSTTSSEVLESLSGDMSSEKKVSKKPVKEKPVVVMPDRYTQTLAMTPAAWYESLYFTYTTTREKGHKLVDTTGKAITTNTIIAAALIELYPAFYANSQINFTKLYEQIKRGGITNYGAFIKALFQFHSIKVTADPVAWTTKCWRDSQRGANTPAAQNARAISETVETLNDLTAFLPGQSRAGKLNSLHHMLDAYQETGAVKEAQRVKAAIEQIEREVLNAS